MIFTDPLLQVITLADPRDALFFGRGFAGGRIVSVDPVTGLSVPLRIDYNARGVLAVKPHRGRVRRSWRTWRKKS